LRLLLAAALYAIGLKKLFEQGLHLMETPRNEKTFLLEVRSSFPRSKRKPLREAVK